MIQIRPVSDLRNKFPEIERAVGGGAPVYLTKNGYGTMVVLSLEAYSRLTDGVESALCHDEYNAKNGTCSVDSKKLRLEIEEQKQHIRSVRVTLRPKHKNLTHIETTEVLGETFPVLSCENV